MKKMDLDNSGGQISSLEEYFDLRERAADRALQLCKRALSNLKRFIGAVDNGDVPVCTKLAPDLIEVGEAIRDAILEATSMNERAIAVHFSNAGFFEEIAAASRAAGLSGVRSTQGVLFSYPYIVERGKGLTLQLGKRAFRALRPSAVAKILAKARDSASKVDRDGLLEGIESAYLLLSERSKSELVPVKAIYDTLTLWPGSKRQYSFFEFLVGLNQIDKNGPHVTERGRRIAFSASTGTRGGKGHRIVTEDGKEVVYSVIGFDEQQKSLLR